MTTIEAPRRKDAEQNRTEILRAAREVFATDPAASIDAVARAAGLSRRALYGHFEDRDALMQAVIAQGAERFNVIATSVHDSDPRVALVQLAAALWSEAEHVIAVTTLALDEGRLAQTAAALAPLRTAVLAICERGAASGSFRQDIEPELTARLVEEAARGVIVRIDPAIGHTYALATRAVLGAAGLDWREANELIETVITL